MLITAIYGDSFLCQYVQSSYTLTFYLGSRICLTVISRGLSVFAFNVCFLIFDDGIGEYRSYGFYLFMRHSVITQKTNFVNFNSQNQVGHLPIAPRSGINFYRLKAISNFY